MRNLRKTFRKFIREQCSVLCILNYTKNIKYQTIFNSCLDTLAFEIGEAYSDLTFSQPLPSIYGQMNRKEMLTGNVEYHLRFCLHLSDAKQGILYDFSSSMTHQVLKYIATLRCCVSEKREMQNMLTYTFTYTQIIDTRLCSKINNKQSTNVFSLKSTPNRLHPFAILMDSGRNSIMN